MKRLVAVVAACAVSFAVLPGCSQSIKFDNSYFYDKDGKFQEEKAKDAYIALMKYHGYPVYKEMREKIWVSDYGKGEFARFGLGARMWVNNEKDRRSIGT